MPTEQKTFRELMPRLHELRDLINVPTPPDAYFQNFDDTVENSGNARDIFTRWEGDLQGLDPSAWHSLKTEASPYLQRKDKRGRGWEPLFDILNQVHAYNYLKTIGCEDIHFIPRSKKPTPDLEALLNGGIVLCEVKTINISQEEVTYRQESRMKPVVRTLSTQLEAGFFQKLHSVVIQAMHQCNAYNLNASQRYVYINICFDEFFGECKDLYYQQIDQYLSANPISGIDLVFHNDPTAFYKPLTMTNATVVNAGHENSEQQ